MRVTSLVGILALSVLIYESAFVTNAGVFENGLEATFVSCMRGGSVSVIAEM